MCGSFALLSIIVVPSAKMLARIALIVAPTETVSKYIFVPINSFANAFTLP